MDSKERDLGRDSAHLYLVVDPQLVLEFCFLSLTTSSQSLRAHVESFIVSVIEKKILEADGNKRYLYS